ncbi:cytochrome P450 [Pleurotus eryngii]|uniref:Cytochrome P450 n=1 Tax=Pleurotus eryngii TaxID=5323 RepID=A0A9P6DDM2_PLEER|nr:cytochrome P450 [Pleurotus eryngii]
MPTEQPWLVYDSSCHIYISSFSLKQTLDSDIIHFNGIGQPVIVLGSAKRCFDLFDKRSAIYSDPPRLSMILELLPYGPWLKRHRKFFVQYFHPNVVPKYRPVQSREAQIFTRRLLGSPENFSHHIRHTFAAMIMDVSYGVRVLEKGDLHTLTAEEAFSSLNAATVPGAFLVDLFSVLKYIPSLIPGTGFKRLAEHAAKVNTVMATCPWDAVKEALKAGTAVPCISTSMLEFLPQGENRAEEEEIARNCAVVSYAGGANTRVSTVRAFFLAMAMSPEVQKKARTELDAVIDGRLPTFEDRPQLPSIQAIVQEAMRWQQVTLLAVSHASMADDESILHDPVMYPKPFDFNPDRFLKDGEINPEARHPNQASFGFGRRMCPGRFFSDGSVYIIVASTLSVFSIQPPLDEQGNPIALEAVMITGLLSYPRPYPCRISPRSPAAKKLIRDSGLEYY